MSRLVSLVPGSTFAGEYTVVRLLSEGGMGAVYVVLQKSTGRERALKVMHPDLVRDAAARRRFEQEARVGARIKSNHIVEVIAAGVEEPEGVPWLAMELLEGMDLASTLKQRGPLPLDKVNEIFGQLCHALSAAHTAGVVHRDLKPENIFMTVAMQEGMPFLVKVVDFGIAKVVGEAHTQATGAIGTPHWMAPEQTVPGSEISFAADIWPLGLIAFRLLTGRLYWRGDSPMAVLREVAFEPLEKASARAEELGCGGRLPPGFDAWFERCVARDPRARFRSAAEARDAFQAIASGKVLPAGDMPAPVLDPMQGSMGTAEWLAQQDRSEGAAGKDSASTAPAESGITAQPTTTGSPASTMPESRAAKPPRRSMWPLGIGAAAIGAAALVTMAVAMRSPKECPDGQTWNGTACAAVTECAPGMQLNAAHQCVPVPAPVPSPVASAVGAAEKKQVTASSCPVGMVPIPGGSFKLGDRGDAVTVASFCMDATEVTVEAYTACVRAGSCSEEGLACTRATYGSTTKKDRPVNCVSWDQAQTYCKRKGKRLPSEEEWEWVARGGAEGRVYPWGNEAPSNQLCWVGEGSTLKNVDLGPCRVGSYPAGATVHGVMDMSGNVYEWTSTPFSPKAAHRTCRGGSWQAETSTLVSAANRLKCAPGQHLYNVGFRCAASM